MKVRDIKQYRKIIQGNIVESDDIVIGTDEHDFLIKLDGLNAKIDARIIEMTNFAVQTEQQVFYEFLQNAIDATAKQFAVTYNHEALVVVNNGEPFLTNDPKGQGEFIGLLQRGKSAKHGLINKIGNFGIGFKLIYDLLSNNLDSIKEDLKGPIVFSWSELNQIEQFTQQANIEVEDECVLSSLSLLTKIVYTYYPAELGEKRLVHNLEEKKELFTSSELQEFRNILDIHFQQNEKLFHNSGTAIYIPLGANVKAKLDAALENQLFKGIGYSLNLVDGIDKAKINQTIIKQAKVKELSLYSGKILISAEKLDYNFFNYFPAFDEYYGFNFIVHSKGFKLPPDRQKIDWSKNSETLQSIQNELVAYIQKLKAEDKKDEYIEILKSVVSSKTNEKFENTEVVKSFFNAIIEKFKQSLPISNGQYENAENIYIKSSALNINPFDVGLDFHWLDGSFKGNYDDFEAKFELEKWTISDLFDESEEGNVRNWIGNLPNEDYKQLLFELEGKKPTFPFIKTSKDNVISKSELKTNENIIPLTSKTKDLKAIFDAQGIEYTDVALLDFEKLLPTIEILERLKKEIEKVKTNLNENQKNIIFKTFQTHFKGEEKNLDIFKNRKGNFYTLGGLVKNDTAIAPSGILHDFQIDPIEPYFDAYDGYFMPNDKIWKAIKENWDRVRTRINNQNYVIAINDITTIYSNRNIEIERKFDVSIDWILASDNTLTTPSAAFLHQNLANLNQDEYDLICDFITQNTGFKTVEKRIFDAIKDIKFCNWSNVSAKNLHDNLIQNKYQIDVAFISVLQKIYSDLLSHFVFTEQNGQLYLEKKNGRKQFYSADNELVVFLENNNYVNLPILIYEQNNNLNELKIESDEFAAELITNPNIGAHRVLIGMVNNCNIQTKLSYLHSLQRLDIISNQQYRYENYEYKVIEMMSNQQLSARIPNYKNKIFIDGQQLSSIQYTDTVTVPNCETSFSLRDLEGYNGANLNVIRANFINLHTTLFDATEKPLDQIFINQVTNGEQVGFLLATDNWDLEFNENLNTEVLSSLFYHKLKKIREVFSKITTWVLLDEQRQNLLLAEEVVPSWVSNWISNDTEKLSWISQNGLRKDTCSTIKIRANYKAKQKWEDNNIETEINNKSKANRTLTWLSNQNDVEFHKYFVENCIKFAEKFILKHEEFPRKVLVKNTQIGNWFFEDVISLDSDNTLYIKGLNESQFNIYRTNLYQNDIKHILDIGEKPQNEVTAKFDENYYELILKEDINIDSISKTEWNTDFYKKWKTEFSKNFIFLTEQEIPSLLKLQYNEIEIKVSDTTASNTCKLVKEKVNTIRQILVKSNTSNQPKTILKVLENHLDSVFQGEQDKFVKLQSLFIENSDEGEGNINIPDATEEQKKVLEDNATVILANIEAIKAGHFGKYDEEGDIIEDDEIPDRAKISGRIGELAIYFWLKNYRCSNVSDDAKLMQPYDLLLERDSKDFYLEIKTKARSFNEDGGSIPIFLRQSQKRWIKSNKVKHYFLTMISLKDVGLYDFYKEFRDSDLEQCEAEIRGALERKMNDDIYKAISENEFHMRLTSPNSQDDPFS